ARLCDAAGVGILQQKASGDVFDDGPRRSGLDFNQAKILLRGKALFGLSGEAGSCYGFDEELGDFLGGSAVDDAIDAEDAAEGRDRVSGKSFLIGFEDRCSGGCAAGIGVLDDGHGGRIVWLRAEFEGELPAGVEVDEVVVA